MEPDPGWGQLFPFAFSLEGGCGVRIEEAMKRRSFITAMGAALSAPASLLALGASPRVATPSSVVWEARKGEMEAIVKALQEQMKEDWIERRRAEFKRLSVSRG